MNHDRTYRPVPYVPAPRLRGADGSMRPHTYGVRVCSCTSIATEPCRPTACAGEYPCCTFTHPATAHYSLLTANSTYTFSAKERDPETGLSYFGSRYYSSDLSVWLSVDPMAGKYPSLSPYTYCADNPVRLVDPNGEDIEIVTETDANGKLIITINFTAKIENKSSHSYSKEEMEQIRDDISSGIKRYYSRQYDAANVVTNVDIICNKDERTNDLMKEDNRHSIYIVDKCSKENRIAEAEDNGRFMNIKWNIGQGANGNNLQRTAAHEFGHLLGLPDIESTDNLMHSGGTGINLTWGQIQEAVANYKQLKINVGIPTRDFERIIDEHKQRYKYGRSYQ